MALHSTASKIGMAIVLFFMLCGVVIALGGLAKATDECRKNTADWQAFGSPGENGMPQPYIPTTSTDAFNLGGRAYICGIHYSLEWWIVVLGLYMIVTGYLAVFVEFFHSKYTVLAMFAIATTLFTYFTSIFVKLAYAYNGGNGTSNTVGQAFKTIAAGGIVTLVCEYVFMFVFGSEETGGPSSEATEAK